MSTQHTPHLSELRLDISDPQASLAFYVGALGMELVSERVAPGEDGTVYTLRFDRGAALALRHRSPDRPGSAPYRPGETDVYWKIGVTVPDVDVARGRLMARGVEVTEPRQFYEIGYLCHLDDPDGYCIELLQHRFSDNHTPQPEDDKYLLGCQPALGQVSLDVSDIDASLAFYRDSLGMRLLSRQAVPGRGFTLYFLAHTDERPPAPSVDAVGNREWLWRRPYTTLELRAGGAGGALVAHPPEGALGFRGIAFAGMAETAHRHDPDGVSVRLGRA